MSMSVEQICLESMALQKAVIVILLIVFFATIIWLRFGIKEDGENEKQEN